MDSKCLFKRKIGKGATIINNVHPSSTDDDQPTCKKHLVTIKTSQSLGEWKRFFSFSLSRYSIEFNNLDRALHAAWTLKIVSTSGKPRSTRAHVLDRQTDWLGLVIDPRRCTRRKALVEGLAKSSLNCLWFSRKIKSLQVPSLFRIITPSTEKILWLQQTDYKFILVLIGTVLTSLIGNARPYT